MIDIEKHSFMDSDIDNAAVIVSGKMKPYISLDLKGEQESINLEYDELVEMLTMLYRMKNEIKKEGK